MNIINIPSVRKQQQDIETQARDWVLMLDSELFGTEDKVALGEWLSRSPQHKEIFQEHAQLWLNMDALSTVISDSEQSYSGYLESPTSSRRWVAMQCVSVVLALVLFTVIYRFGPEVFQGGAVLEEYATAVGEVKSVALADGSEINLNTATRVSVSYQENARLVHLVQGEAFFDVAHDPDRPFMVYVGKYSVKAVGTAFSIEASREAVEVIVTNGKIEVSSYQSSITDLQQMDSEQIKNAGSLIPLDKGQVGVFNKDEGGKLDLVQEIQADSLMKRLSWRDGLFIFDNDTLSTVVEEINRYTQVRIIITDPGIRDKRFGGYYPLGEIADILETLQISYGVQVDRFSEELIYLSAAD